MGATRAGFKLASAIEIDKQAIETHSKNFPNSKHLPLDINKLSGEKLLSESGLKRGELSGLVGGPPCQGFSAMGKRDVNDGRNSLFNHFFRLVEETLPEFFVAENVTGIMRPEYEQIRENAFSIVSESYDLLAPLKVSAKDCGAATIRTRIFFIGTKKKSKINLSNMVLPEQTATTVEPALSGLPEEINPNWQKEEDGWQSVETMCNSASEMFIDRATYNIPKGVGHPPALERYFERGQISGCMGTRHTRPVADRYAALEHGKQDSISKSVKLNPQGFCPTLRAGTDRSKGSYQAVRPIHPRQARVITPREAARLQGFPDWFVFHPTKWHSFRQIGNSVCPIVAEALLNQVMQRLA